MSHSAERCRKEPLSFSLSSGVEKVWMRGWGGLSKFSVENFLSHSAEKFRRANFQGVTNFAYRKSLRFRGLCHDFTAKKFCLTVPKHFVDDSFSAVFQRISGSEKVYG